MYTPVDVPEISRMLLIRVVCAPADYDREVVTLAVDDLMQLGTVAVISDGYIEGSYEKNAELARKEGVSYYGS